MLFVHTCSTYLQSSYAWRKMWASLSRYLEGAVKFSTALYFCSSTFTVFPWPDSGSDSIPVCRLVGYSDCDLITRDMYDLSIASLSLYWLLSVNCTKSRIIVYFAALVGLRCLGGFALLCIILPKSSFFRKSELSHVLYTYTSYM